MPANITPYESVVMLIPILHVAALIIMIAIQEGPSWSILL